MTSAVSPDTAPRALTVFWPAMAAAEGRLRVTEQEQRSLAALAAARRRYGRPLVDHVAVSNEKHNSLWASKSPGL
jgi:hypothetical protein